MNGVDNLEQVLEYALSRPPSSAGLRLRSERDLAALLETDHFKVRKSLSELVRRGVLVRRHGSGTYVRKVPKISRTLSSTDVKIAPKSLFAINQPKDDAASPLEPMKHQQQLQLSLWADMEPSQSRPGQALIKGAVYQTQQAGHNLAVQSIRGDGGKILDTAELVKRLKDNPSDGHLVEASLAEQLLQATDNGHAPIVFFSESNRVVKYEPLVMLDLLEGVSRGVHLLAKQGHKKIGFIGPDTAESVESYRKTYERAVVDADLDYANSRLCKPRLQDSIAACRQLLAGPTPPEAILVADDSILNGVAEALVADGILPGRDIAVVTLSNASSKLPKGIEWSRLEFDFAGLGEVAVSTLLGLLQTAGLRANSSALYAKWIPGKTYIAKNR